MNELLFSKYIRGGGEKLLFDNKSIKELFYTFNFSLIFRLSFRKIFQCSKRIFFISLSPNSSLWKKSSVLITANFIFLP